MSSVVADVTGAFMRYGKSCKAENRQRERERERHRIEKEGEIA